MYINMIIGIITTRMNEYACPALIFSNLCIFLELQQEMYEEKNEGKGFNSAFQLPDSLHLF